MKKIINDPYAFPDETIEGILRAHPEALRAVDAISARIASAVRARRHLRRCRRSPVLPPSSRTYLGIRLREHIPWTRDVLASKKSFDGLGHTTVTWCKFNPAGLRTELIIVLIPFYPPLSGGATSREAVQHARSEAALLETNDVLTYPIHYHQVSMLGLLHDGPFNTSFTL